MVESKLDSIWMINPKTGIISVPIGEVSARKGEGWTECPVKVVSKEKVKKSK